MAVLRLLPILTVVVLACACGPRNRTTMHFPPTTETLLNPERGYFIDIDLVDGRDFRDVRAQGYTLGFAYVRLDPWRTVALSPELIDGLSRGFEAARDAGIKVILRFAYNKDEYGADAPKWAILAHIEQLTPLLRANADVIAVLDAGFIGAWGEWHSSTYGLDNQRDRGDVLWALLNALPLSRSTLVRSPVYKVAAYGDTSDGHHAFSGSDPSRVGHVNSCFLASESDLGTYADPIDRWKRFLAQDGLATPVGGETCALAPPRTDCATALDELRHLHWSFLNARYHPAVIERWRAQGCFGEIGDHLGYRLELESVTFPAHIVPGGTVDVTIRLRNTGYAAMYNPRPVYLMIDDTWFFVPEDPRRWKPGAITIHARVEVPATLPPGAHQLALWLPDADDRLRTPARAELFGVRLAGARWERGRNVLTNALQVVAPTKKE